MPSGEGLRTPGAGCHHGPERSAHGGASAVGDACERDGRELRERLEGERQESRQADPLSALLPVLAYALRTVLRWARRPLVPAARLWRRNLQARVVATTLLMSLGVVLLLGIVVIGQVRGGLLEAKNKAAENQA